MIIVGHKDIPFVEFANISCIDDIANTKPNSFVLFDYDIDLMKYCYKNNIDYGVNIFSIKEAIFANSLGAKFILSPKEFAIILQPIVQNYMFDSKNLAIIKSEDEIEELALKEVDGVIIL